ncbi:hypothetical protein QYF36_011279 [Acer negundo]|nr:hypothetical protein QYF36_011279 [Acer negundo]
MRKQYLAWNRLTTTIGHGYNAETHTINWPPERWEEYTQGPIIGVLVRNTSTPFSSPYAKRFVRLSKEDETMQTMRKITHSKYNSSAQPIQFEEQTFDKKQKETKANEDREEVSRIISALEKSDDRGPTVKDCREILIKLLYFKDPLYFLAINALCKRREYRELWIKMDSDKERLAWVRSLPRRF